MRVAHYYHWALQGEFGTGVAVRGWCGALAAAGDAVRLVAAREGTKVPVPAGVELVPLPKSPADLPSARTLRRAFRGADLVVLHGGWDPRNLIAAANARAEGVGYVITAHGVYYPQVFVRRKARLKAMWWRALERRHVERAAAVHLFFPPEVEHLRSRGVRGQVILAPNGFAAPDGVTWSPSSRPYLVWLGRLDPEHKGLDLLLRALASFPASERPRLRLHGVDWDRGRSVVGAIIRDLGLEASVTLEAPVFGARKWEVLAEARAFLYPSRWDAAPMAVVEAASIGLPVLVTRFPLGEFLAQRGGAVAVDPDPAAVAEGLRRIAGSDAAPIGRRGAAVVREHLSWGAVASTWRAQVERVLDPVPAGGPT